MENSDLHYGKVFDKALQSKLLLKHLALGIKGNIVAWVGLKAQGTGIPSLSWE